MKDMVMVNEPVLPVYRLPESGSERVDELLYGMWGQLMGEICGEYVHICTGYGYEGWCRRDGLKHGEWDVCRAWCSSRAFIHSRFADIHKTPQISSEVLLTLPKGSLITVCEEYCRDGWQQVEFLDRRIGYVRSAQLGPICAGRRDCYWQYGGVMLPQKEETALRESLVRTAKMYLGTPYRWGGKSPEGIDCSGLCSLVYWMHGIVIFRDSSIRPEYAVRQIPVAQMAPGDLLYFPGHMAMYIGDGRYIHSSNTCHGVVISSLNPEDETYFPLLDGKLIAAGSVFLHKEA
ncbi:MAG: C40 family peptidase [Lachnospiraceae bacterium]|nr:C40 family peptidase [Lachnospiraceae bacterium]